MRAERGLLFVESHPAGIVLGGVADNVHDRIPNLILEPDEARWLAFVALPALIAAKVPSEPSAKVQESESDDGQIPGQLAIEG